MSKTEIFFQQLALEQAEQEKIKNIELKSVIVDPKDSRWSFLIKAPKLLSAEVYHVLHTRVNEVFPYSCEIELEVENAEVHYDVLSAYFDIYKSRFEESSLSSTYLTQTFLYWEETSKTLFLETVTMLSKSFVDNDLRNIRHFFYKAGFKGIEIKSVLSEKSEHAEKLEKILDDVVLPQSERPKPKVAPVPATPSTEAPKARKQPLQNKYKNEAITKIYTVNQYMKNIVIEGFVFDVEVRDLKSGNQLELIKITDYTDSIVVKRWLSKDVERVSKDKWYKFFGNPEVDTFQNNELTLMARDFEQVSHEVKRDHAQKKRIELHSHTNLSPLDGVIPPKKLIEKAIEFGHEAIAITDHNGVQAFPEAYYASGKGSHIKVLYGVEINVIQDPHIYWNYSGNEKLQNETFVVFDFETTGLHARYDEIIEVGAVKIEKGRVTDEFQCFVQPSFLPRQEILDLTHISEADLATAEKIDVIFPRLKDFLGDAILVAHNAQFDRNFLEKTYTQFGQQLNNAFLDTLDLARFQFPEMKRHGLKFLTKKLGVDLSNHHRAIYDAQATAQVLLRMIELLKMNGIESLPELDQLITQQLYLEKTRTTHVTLIAQTQVGLKNLFRIVSEANTTYLCGVPKIPFSVIEEFSEGVLIGSACFQGDVFSLISDGQISRAESLIQKIDYIELQPLSQLEFLVESGEFGSIEEIKQTMTTMIELAQKHHKYVVATGNVHHLLERDKIFRQIYIESQVGKHHLARKSVKTIPSQHFMTTDEMLQDFDWLSPDLREMIVIDHPKQIADTVEHLEIIKDQLFTPNMDNAENEIRELSYKKAWEMYGKELPELIEKRLEKELNSIIGHGFSVIYLISQRLVKKSMDDGYVVGSRGSVGSSVVACFIGISEVNPLPPHYYCSSEECFYTEFTPPELAKSGFDLPDKQCPNCNKPLKKDGQDIPFETFLGFEGDKVPDIDLNFSGDYQSEAHAYTKVLFGEDKVYRAGTIATVASKTAFGYVNGFLEDHSMKANSAEIARLINGCEGVKRTTGQHPGGIIVVPDYMDIYDITPIQFPADDAKSAWRTTHFDFHSIHDNLLKLDILGHDNPTIIRMLQDLSGIEPDDIPMDDPLVYSLFASNEALKIENEAVKSPVGTYGIPEFGTRTVRRMLAETKPKNFAELVQISGLSHGTDVWSGNAQELIKDNTCTLEEVIGCRDDIMTYLMYKGVEPTLAFTIMESVRKGKGLKDEWIDAMLEKDVPKWYIESCEKIKYMFPKAHAAAYVTMAVRIAYFKVYYPLYFYASFFSIRANDFDLETMYKGHQAILAKVKEIDEKGFSASVKEKALQTNLELALEMTARGYTFEKIDLNVSHSDNFIVSDNGLIPPLRAVEGLGDAVAKAVMEERKIRPFLSKEDLQKRTKMSKSIVERLSGMGVLDTLDDSNQMTLF